jgi:bacterioferritin (cytochrome b1)
MGFDFDRIEVESEAEAPGALELLSQALQKNLTAEQAAIHSYRQIAARGKFEDEAALRLVKVVLAVEEEHAQILSTMMASLNELRS